MEEIDEQEYLNILTSLLKKKVRSIKASNDYERNGKLVRFAAGHGYEIGDILLCMKRMGYDDEYME
jgi:regulatory protein